MECTKSKLCTRLTNSLSCDDTYSLTQLYHAGSSQITAITLHADTLLALAGKYRANLNTLNRRIFDSFGLSLCYLLTGTYNQLASCRMNNIMYRYTTEDTLIQSRNHLVTVLQGCTNQTTQGTTVLLRNNHIMGHIDKTTCQVTSIGSLHSGISKTLTGTV